jgi:hypothetical protein
MTAANKYWQAGALQFSLLLLGSLPAARSATILNYIGTQSFGSMGRHGCLQAVTLCLALTGLCSTHCAIAQKKVANAERNANAERHAADPIVSFAQSRNINKFALVVDGKAAPIYVASGNSETVAVVAQAFAHDLERVTGTRPQVLTSLPAALPGPLVIAGVIGH